MSKQKQEVYQDIISQVKNHWNEITGKLPVEDTTLVGKNHPFFTQDKIIASFKLGEFSEESAHIIAGTDNGRTAGRIGVTFPATPPAVHGLVFLNHGIILPPDHFSKVVKIAIQSLQNPPAVS